MDSPTTMSVRKLPKWLKTANFIYQIILILFGFVNTLLTAVDESVIKVPVAYFKCYAIIISLLPVLWSNILDASKKYIQTLSPMISPDSTEDKNSQSSFPIDSNDPIHSLETQMPEDPLSIQETQV